jgi:hypothetical protein
MNSHREIIDLWPSRVDFAAEVGIKYERASAWYRRNSIHSDFWADVVRAAGGRGFYAVTTDLLAQIKSAERGKAHVAA